MQVEKHVIGMIFMDLELEVNSNRDWRGHPREWGQGAGGWESVAKQLGAY